MTQRQQGAGPQNGHQDRWRRGFEGHGQRPLGFESGNRMVTSSRASHPSLIFPAGRMTCDGTGANGVTSDAFHSPTTPGPRPGSQGTEQAQKGVLGAPTTHPLCLQKERCLTRVHLGAQGSPTVQLWEWNRSKETRSPGRVRGDTLNVTASALTLKLLWTSKSL